MYLNICLGNTKIKINTNTMREHCNKPVNRGTRAPIVIIITLKRKNKSKAIQLHFEVRKHISHS